jgi:hypothetical protein
MLQLPPPPNNDVAAIAAAANANTAAATAVIANVTTPSRTLIIQDPPGLSTAAGSNVNNCTSLPLLASFVSYGSVSFFPLSVSLGATVRNIIASNHG